MPPWFCQVTVVPGRTVTVAGKNALPGVASTVRPGGSASAGAEASDSPVTSPNAITPLRIAAGSIHVSPAYVTSSRVVVARQGPARAAGHRDRRETATG